MLVETGEYLFRDEQPYQVVCADENCFVIGKSRYDEKEQCRITSYENLEAYSNDETINTLEELRFIKEVTDNG